MGVSYDDVAEIGSAVSVNKPMGIVFGENRDPYYGLSVDDVAEGLNGGIAGLRVGDQLLSIDGEVVVGKDFDTVMDVLQNGPATLDLVVYRGPVSALYTILGNRLADGEYVRDEEEEEEAVVMDENYEPPAYKVEERKALGVGDFFKGLGKVGQMVKDDLTSGVENIAEEAKDETKKKKGGFFGMGGESVQLDGDDANTLK